jgi:hypothetical protein
MWMRKIRDEWETAARAPLEAEIFRLRAIEEDAGYLADAAKHLIDHLFSEHPDWYCEDMDTVQHFAVRIRATLRDINV